MKLTKKQRVYLAIAIGMLILIITNPSANAFKEYLGVNSNKYFQRKYNFYLCSIYFDGDKYLAVAGNFFPVNPDKQVKHDTIFVSSDEEKMVDTSKMSKNNLIYDTVGNTKLSLYEKLISDGYSKKNLGYFDTFNNKLKDNSNVSKLYNVLLREGYREQQLGDKEQFIYYLSK